VDETSEIARLSFLLERRLLERGILSAEGNVVRTLPPDFLDRIDGIIENSIELEGLLKIGVAVRHGEALSAPVANAAHMMIMEVCEAVFDPDELQAVLRTH